MAFPNGKTSYGELTDAERWEWHTRIYVWRHLRLGAALTAGSAPTDPEGKWFDRTLIEQRLKVIEQEGKIHD